MTQLTTSIIEKPMLNLSHHHFIITGAAGGMGRAIACLFSQLGAQLSLWDKSAEVFALAESLGADAWQSDLKDPQAINARAAHAHRLAPLTGLVLAQGVLRLGPAEQLSLTDWHHCLDHNATAGMLCCQAVAPLLSGGGSITLIGSNASYLARQQMAAYAASKACMAQYLNCLGLELAPRNIRCNTLSPGSTATAMQAQMPDSSHILKGAPEQFRTGIPLGKLASPDDIAAACAFLVSPAAGHITLANLTIDGGASLSCH